ncbi:MAG: PTS sugar transporter subunit IIB [Symbiobacteriia bacterium]
MKILLCCAAGMSTSLLVENMKKVAAERGLEAEIVAVATNEFESLVGEYDVALLGPQVRYKLTAFKQIGADKGVPVDVIDSVAYGTVNGPKVLDQALALKK